MAVTILIPTALRQFTDGASEVIVEAKSVAEALDGLASKHSDLQKHLFTDKKTLRSFVNVYVNEEDIRQKDGLQTVLSGNETVMLVPSIAGGKS
jgi:adenylyltransferase/sulfurtransferase